MVFDITRALRIKVGQDEPNTSLGERRAIQERAESTFQASWNVPEPNGYLTPHTNDIKCIDILEDVLGSRSRENLLSKQYIKSLCSKTAKPGQICH